VVLPLALLAGLAVDMPVLLALAVLAVWTVAAYHSGRALAHPGASPWRGLCSAASPPVAAGGLAVAVLGVPVSAIGAAVLMVVVASVAVGVRRRLRRTLPVRAIVLGDGPGIESALDRWSDDSHIRIVGGCLIEDSAAVAAARPRTPFPLALGHEELGALLDSTDAELVLVAGGHASASLQLREAAWQLETRQVSLALLGPLDSVAPHRLTTTAFGGATLVHIAPSRPAAVVRMAKSAVDRLAGLVLLVAAAPAIAVLVAMVRFETPGPGLFRQTRVGLNGKPFTMYKLRTMSQDAERLREAMATQNEVDGLLFKIRADPRITRVGRLLRRTSLDELPQLINVVRGEMSLIGPRPALPREVAAYDSTMRRRLAVKPGMTGLWQVSGRSDLPFDHALRLDLHYADNWRLRDDASIALRTARAVISSRGAY